MHEEELKMVVLDASQRLWDEKPKVRMQRIPTLSDKNSAKELMDAAELNMKNVQKGRLSDFLKLPRPEEYSAALMDLVKRVSLKDKFEVVFFAGQKMTVDRKEVIPERHDYSASSVMQESEYMYKFDVRGESRKRLVKRLAMLTGRKEKYLGFPSCAINVGDLYVDVNGTVEGRLSKRVIKALARSGFKEVDV